MKNIPNRLSMPRQLKKTLVCLLLILLLITIYGQIRHHDYIHYDDHLIMMDSPILTRSLSPANIYRAFIDRPHHVPYRIPLTTITHMTKWHFFGDDFGLHHLVSLFFHALTVILIFFLIERATSAITPAAFAAALVAVHPLNVEAVAWLTNINTIMADFFLVATLLAYVYYTKRPGLKRYFFLFIPFGLGLMGKPTLIVGPFLMLALDYWPLLRYKQKPEPPGHVFLIIEKLPFLLIALGPYLIELISKPEKIVAGIQSGGGIHPEGLRYLFWPLIKGVLPIDLTICRAYPPAGSPGEAVILLVLLGLVTLVIIWLSRRYPSIGFGWFWYLAAISPIIIMLVGSGRPIADRHTYIPMAGIFMAIPYFLHSIFPHGTKGRVMVSILGIAVLVLLTVLSTRQVKYWQNSQTVFEHAVQINPENTRARTNLGDVFLRSRQIDQAIAHYTWSLKTAPDNARIHAKLAYALSQQGENQAARRHYEQALALTPDYAVAHHNFADFLADEGKIEKAINHYYLALQTDPGLHQTHNNLAVLLSRQGKYERARQHLYQALRIKPDYKTARENLENLPASP
ncbi:MAG: tetratricopeptide repeat protein [Desulfosudaceae bacterium]